MYFIYVYLSAYYVIASLGKKYASRVSRGKRIMRKLHGTFVRKSFRELAVAERGDDYVCWHRFPNIAVAQAVDEAAIVAEQPRVECLPKRAV